MRQDFKILTQPERGKRALRDPIKKRQRLIVLFIDDAHDLHSKTLIGLKRFATRLSDIESRPASFGAILSFIAPKGHLNHKIGENWWVEKATVSEISKLRCSLSIKER